MPELFGDGYSPVTFNTSHAGEYSLNDGVDWIGFEAGNVAVPGNPGQTIKIRAENMTQIKFTSDNYDDISITNGHSLTSMEDICEGLSNLNSFTSTNNINVTNFRYAWYNCYNLTFGPGCPGESGAVIIPDGADTYRMCGLPG